MDKEFGGLGQEAIQRFWTFLAGLKRFNPQKCPFLEGNIFSRFRVYVLSVIPTLFAFQESE